MTSPSAEAGHAEAAEASAFRAIFRTEFAYVWHTLRRLGIRSRDLDDVTHDVFVAVFRALHDYDPRRPLRPWLFGVAFRVASDYRRLARNHRELLGDNEAPEPVDQSPTAEHAASSRQDREFVLAALDKLDLDRRAVIVLHDLDGQPIPEIAAALGIPLNTAYSRLRLAREQMRAALHRVRAQRGAP